MNELESSRVEIGLPNGSGDEPGRLTCFIRSWSLRVGLSRFQSGCNCGRKVACGAAASVMEKNHPRLVPDHVVMDGNDVDA